MPEINIILCSWRSFSRKYCLTSRCHRSDKLQVDDGTLAGTLTQCRNDQGDNQWTFIRSVSLVKVTVPNMSRVQRILGRGSPRSTTWTWTVHTTYTRAVYRVWSEKNSNAGLEWRRTTHSTDIFLDSWQRTLLFTQFVASSSGITDEWSMTWL